MEQKNEKRKTIVIGITGSIAAFKAEELVKELSADYDIEVILTQSGKKLIEVEKFQKLCPVRDCLFQPGMTYRDYLEREKIGHISLADKAGLILVAPATANLIGKIANGIADDLLTTTIMASKAKILIAPAMNNNMYTNPIMRENTGKLKKLGYFFIGPATGRLACNRHAVGRLSDTGDIAKKARVLLEEPLKNKSVLITAGSTIEPIDPVRHITNKSSGKMGYALAETAKAMGADVTLVIGPASIAKPGVKVIEVNTAQEMYDACMQNFAGKNLVICSAAVSDYKVLDESREKIKKENNATLKLELTKNPDILKEIGRRKTSSQKLVGFALETENLMENAVKKLKNKNCDMIIANSQEAINSENNKVFIITKNAVEELEEMPKSLLAAEILDRFR
ncbi:MAG: bifunctional phosphopantothenoylcysteine decarboxylase/phosphopantothenate--cysteine ligase CoaBC [Candidatus Diapherotrites archaeon]|nr:bifunctional phosphopantothenoylcysteine decarboxylase/phosphopantothenate--cysteine ligase CoaBC [Candidatus Diapherotrites archaeon]